MSKYKFKYGMGGSYGGARSYHYEELENEEKAYEVLDELILEVYQSYEGMRGLPEWHDCYEEACEEHSDATEEELSDMAEERYRDSVESWGTGHFSICSEEEWHRETVEAYE